MMVLFCDDNSSSTSRITSNNNRYGTGINSSKLVQHTNY